MSSMNKLEQQQELRYMRKGCGMKHSTVGLSMRTISIFKSVVHRKKDYPGLLDITAAGHLLAVETVESGIREVKEELGLDINVDDVVKMGMTSCSIVSENMIDNEFCHVYIYPFKHDWDSFDLQYEEVSGVVRADLNEAEAFFLGKTATLNIEGYEYFPDGQRAKIVRPVSTAQFVPYRELYVAHVIQFVKDKMFKTT